MASFWSNWLRNCKRSTPQERRKHYRPRLEVLEDRLTPATFFVNTTADTVAVNLATGQDSSGNISLRSAIQAANSASNAGDDTIVLPAGTYTRTLAGSNENAAATGDLDVVAGNGKLTITGAGADVTIIDAAGIDRVFEVRTSANLQLSGVTVRGGAGGIFNSGTLTVSGSILSGNSTTTGGGIYNADTATVSGSTLSGNSAVAGGGIYNIGVLTVSSSTLFGNSAATGGGIQNDCGILTVSASTLSGNSGTIGGGIYNQGTATVSGSTLSGNSAVSEGGGIRNVSTLTVSGSTFSGNSAGTMGGGISNDGGILTVSASTFSGNSAGTIGGGIRSGGTLTVNGSTLSGNSAVSFGGGIFSALGTTTVSGSTLSGNSAAEGGGIYNQATATLRNSILAGNTATTGPNFRNNVSSNGNNLVDNDAGSSGWIASDLLNVDALLGPLSNNGGPTLTHALLAGSPALDAGNNTGASALDQRGFLRIKDGPDADTTATTDIGAFEAQIWMADIGDQATNEDTPLAFNFATSLGIANVVATSDNPALVRAANLSVTGAGTGRTLTITPLANQSGTALIAVTASDGTSSMTDTFILTVNPANDAPLLDNSGVMRLQAINEDDTSSFGTRVSDIILSAGGDRITDLDTGAVEGIALSGVDNSNGVWQFSTDSATTWTSFGAVTATAARLLNAGAFVRFVPNANFNGAADFTFRAWDQTSGANGGTADTSGNGGNTAFSTASATATITVLAVNDAPTGAADTIADVAEDSGARTIAFSTLLGNDAKGPANESGQSLTIIAVGNAVGGAVNIVGTDVIFTPTADFNGAASFTYTLQDNGTTNGVADPKTAMATVSFTITPVNDAPMNTVPPAQKTTVNKPLVFSGARRISIADVDAGTAIMRVTLTVTNGTLVLGTTAGLASVTGNGMAKITLRGTLAQINNALNNLRFRPAANFRGKAKLTIVSEDLGSSGVGGPKMDTDAVAITVV